MPLEKGSGKKVVKRNFNELRGAGYPVKQAYAVAMKQAKMKKQTAGMQK
jgi:hypothetical protein